MRDAITFRRIPVWVVVGCPDGEAYIPPETARNARIKGGRKRLRKKAKKEDRMRAPGSPDSFGAAVLGDLPADTLGRIRETINGQR